MIPALHVPVEPVDTSQFDELGLELIEMKLNLKKKMNEARPVR